MIKGKKFTVAALVTGLALGSGLTASADELVTVEAGDTFWSMAQEYGVGVDELIGDNEQFDPTALQIGSQIEVDNEDTVHFVQPGDTLSELAVTYGVTVDQLMEFNPGVDPYALMPGDGIVYGTGDDDEIEVENENEDGDDDE